MAGPGEKYLKEVVMSEYECMNNVQKKKITNKKLKRTSFENIMEE